MSATSLSLGATDKEKLILAAFEAKQCAYSPYSKFRVGASLLSTEGQIIKGANIENASYGKIFPSSNLTRDAIKPPPLGGTICAERTAFVKAVSEGTKNFSALAVVTDLKSAVSPCGMCRQVIREFCKPHMPILLVPVDYEDRKSKGDPDGGILHTSIEELLPHSFGPEHLELPRET
ncbi:hypothetical protein NLI96_g1820 [Meripilus lineatus]|uniref:CMP/dCMP-type deaminase domain-containing protein n=1 Tax=Meripilus lineatus TaxID=2056292 RepID=A0AAD5V9X0_9APHY|nr:hypothetical protein NLI96_g1820 [Physisporinus lineatus]